MFVLEVKQKKINKLTDFPILFENNKINIKNYIDVVYYELNVLLNKTY